MSSGRSDTRRFGCLFDCSFWATVWLKGIVKLSVPGHTGSSSQWGELNDRLLGDPLWEFVASFWQVLSPQLQ
jgi:hypothetical protein